MRIIRWAAVLSLVFASGVADAAERPGVFVSIAPQAWLVKRLAGDAVEVFTLLPAGANPHTFEVGAPQVKRLSLASLYLTVGMPFETRLAGRAAKLNAALRVTGMDAGIAKLHGGHEHGPAGESDADGCDVNGDPHIWLSPRLFAVMASNTAVALTALLPQRAAELAASRDAAVAEIAATDRAVRETLAGTRVKAWAAYHPSWRYFAKEYGLSLFAIEEDGKPPSARHLAEVMAASKAAGVRVVFAEPQYDTRSAQALADHIGARLTTVDPLGEDWPAVLRSAASELAAVKP